MIDLIKTLALHAVCCKHSSEREIPLFMVGFARASLLPAKVTRRGTYTPMHCIPADGACGPTWLKVRAGFGTCVCL
jgi:hypothetical protein